VPTRAGTAILIGLAIMLAGCGGESGDDGPTVVEGTVIAVDGTLTDVTSFTVRLPDGHDLVFVPADGVLFDGSAPLSHLQDHVAGGEPVRVGYRELEDGTLSAVLVEDG
jgi:hypothetical protein